MSIKKSKFVVVDSGAFIKNAKIEDYGDEIYTIQAVVREIRDKQTRSRLQVLPYSLNFREPTPQSVSHVNEIAKQTGDFRSLSATDIRIIALTHELHEQFKGTEFPMVAADDTIEPRCQKVDYRDAFGDISADDESEESGVSDEDDESEDEEEDEEVSCEVPEKEEKKCDDEANEAGDMDAITYDSSEVLKKVDDEPKCQAMEVSDEDDDSDWITANNLSNHDFSEDFQTFKSDKSNDEPEVPPLVSCITTDFAMQNVLLGMGLPVRSVEGMIVQSLKSFALWCYACNKHTLDQTKTFCPSCGNKTLRKITTSIDKDGKVNLHFAKKFQWKNKGKNKQMEAPFRGGKYSNNALHSADQPMPHQRPSKKALQRLDLEASSADCPFATRDLSSRAAKLGMNKRFRGGRRK